MSYFRFLLLQAKNFWPLYSCNLLHITHLYPISKQTENTPQLKVENVSNSVCLMENLNAQAGEVRTSGVVCVVGNGESE